ncbi:MAG: phosphodiester glycosidase family protein [Candidatus Eisenbacteria bacterium]
MSRLRPASILVLLGLLLAAARSPDLRNAEAGAQVPAAIPWTSLADGMDIASLDLPRYGTGSDSALTILRIDPRQWELRLLSASATPGQELLTARQWCEREGLMAAINAGMFATDGITHVGYLRCDEHVNNGQGNAYRSAAAFAPRSPDLPSFRIFDLDETSLEWLRERYGCLVQNLRLIKRPGENRWSHQEREWSEAALGEDSHGRVLLILSRIPFAMYDLNQLLLSLPIDLVSAQHLEGGPEAQLYVKVGRYEREWVGGYGGGFLMTDASPSAWPIPNVLGIAPLDGPGRSGGGR